MKILQNSVKIFQTDNGHLYFNSPTYNFTFNLRDFNSNLNINGGDFVGFSTSASTANGKYGIQSTGQRTVGLYNSKGSIQLNTNGSSAYTGRLSQVTKEDLENPANYDANDEYIGPKFDLREKIEELQAEKATLLATVNDLVARVEALEGN